VPTNRAKLKTANELQVVFALSTAVVLSDCIQFLAFERLRLEDQYTSTFVGNPKALFCQRKIAKRDRFALLYLSAYIVYGYIRHRLRAAVLAEFLLDR